MKIVRRKQNHMRVETINWELTLPGLISTDFVSPSRYLLSKFHYVDKGRSHLIHYAKNCKEHYLL